MIKEIRSSVQRTAEAMEKRLQDHDQDWGFEGWLNPECPNWSLIDRIDKNCEELQTGLFVPIISDINMDLMKRKAVDICNLAHMILDKLNKGQVL